LNPSHHSQKLSNLKKRAYSGVFWSAIELLSYQFISFIIGLIIARILDPSDYGLMGMISIFIALGQSVVESGFNSALIQKKETTEEDYSTAFYFFIVVGIVMCLGLFLSAGPVSRFYNEPRLELITQVMSLNFVFVSIGLIQRSILMKELNFRSLAKVSVVSGTAAGAVGLISAFRGGGVWALVLQIIVKNIVDALLLSLIRRWKPTRSFSVPRFKELYGFGHSIFLSGLVNQFFRNIFYLIIGKLYSEKQLGYYTRADQFQKTPSNMILNIIRRVSFPVFSQLQDEPADLRRGYQKSMRLTMFCVVPFMFLIILVSKSFVLVVLTQKWLPMVPFMRLLSLNGIFFSIYAINMSVVNAKGRGRLFFILNSLDKILVLVFIFITVKMGVITMIYGQIAAAIISYFVIAANIRRILDLKIVDQIRNISPVLIFSCVMLLLGRMLGRLAPEGLPRLLLLFAGGSFIYLAQCYLFKVNELFEVWEIVRGKIRTKMKLGAVDPGQDLIG
jgi:teichuronic acid exporter